MRTVEIKSLDTGSNSNLRQKHGNRKMDLHDTNTMLKHGSTYQPSNAKY